MADLTDSMVSPPSLRNSTTKAGMANRQFGIQ